MPGDPLLARPSAESVLPTRGRRSSEDQLKIESFWKANANPSGSLKRELFIEST
jgi:hypothetical protein